MLREQTAASLKRLIAVNKGEEEADLIIENGTVLNVYTGEWLKQDVVIAGKRIAYIGDKPRMKGEKTQVVNAEGMYLVPGYIEPHAHPNQFYTPFSFAEKALSLGTTAIVNDNMIFFVNMEDEKIEEVWSLLNQLPIKMLWGSRLDGQNTKAETMAKFTDERVKRFLRHPLVVQAGELAAWRDLLDGDERLAEWIAQTQRLNKRVEGHLPGASYETLSAAAAAGITACHESINIEEVYNRLRLGLYTTLRYSSIRLDVPHLVKGLLEKGIKGTSRLMMTTDGLTPPMLGKGFTDEMLRQAMQAGLDPVLAYQMVTINPATYYALDGELGGIAPGRLADINLLSAPNNPTPVRVLAEGEWVAENGRVTIDWPEFDWSTSGLDFPDMKWEADPEWFEIRHSGQAYPVIKQVNAVITRKEETDLPVVDGKLDISGQKGLVYAAVISKEADWISKAVLKGFVDHLDGLASSYNGVNEILVIGQSPISMAKAVARLRELNGGIVLMEGESLVCELPLSIGGAISDLPIDTLISLTSRLEEALRSRGYRFEDPFYSMLFLSMTHLPDLRLTPDGVYAVKTREILIPGETLK
jgi:adenine deaminase